MVNYTHPVFENLEYLFVSVLFKLEKNMFKVIGSEMGVHVFMWDS